MEERLTHLGEHSPLFSHDGIHDSQTHLASPSFFYEQLRRQLALSARSTLSFSIIKISFEKNCKALSGSSIGAADVLHFSCELKTLTRSEDCIGRIGVSEFLILISDEEVAARQLLNRLESATSLSLNHTLHISLSIVTSLCGESGLDILNRLDTAALSTH